MKDIADSFDKLSRDVADRAHLEEIAQLGEKRQMHDLGDFATADHAHSNPFHGGCSLYHVGRFPRMRGKRPTILRLLLPNAFQFFVCCFWPAGPKITYKKDKVP